MMKESYHHGDLRNSMINAGIDIINEEGIKSLSLRKVAKQCNVSHTAPYKHFENKDMLVNAIKDHIAQGFASYLSSIDLSFAESDEDRMLVFGKSYIKYFIDNPSYFTFLFMHPNFSLNISKDNISCENFPPFSIFIQTVDKIMSERNIDREDFIINMIAMLSMVDGLISLFVSKNVSFEGDYMEYVDKVLRQSLKL